MDPFIGRRHILCAIAKLLKVATPVTLLGTPGVGKTRIAREFAAHFAGPVHWVSPRQGLDVALSDANVDSLVVLDGVSTYGPGRSRTHELCSRSHVLVTGRDVSSLPREEVIPVPPLSPAKAAELVAHRLGEGLCPMHASRVLSVTDGLPGAIDLLARAHGRGVLDRALARVEGGIFEVEALQGRLTRTARRSIVRRSLEALQLS